MDVIYCYKSNVLHFYPFVATKQQLLISCQCTGSPISLVSVVLDWTRYKQKETVNFINNPPIYWIIRLDPKHSRYSILVIYHQSLETEIFGINYMYTTRLQIWLWYMHHGSG